MANRPGVWMLAGKSVFAALFILGGVLHFVVPESYVRIMPPYLPYDRPLVLLSGVFEIYTRR